MVQETKKPSGINRDLLKKIAIAAGILILAFLLGYLPSMINSRATEQQNVELAHKLKGAELGSQLAMASYEVNRNNYANAAQFSSKFFDGLRDSINESNDQALKQKLQAMLARRDEITANLAQADPSVKEKLAQMVADYFEATHIGKLPGQ
jgi:outer membrane cobalamin receptor